MTGLLHAGLDDDHHHKVIYYRAEHVCTYIHTYIPTYSKSSDLVTEMRRFIIPKMVKAGAEERKDYADALALLNKVGR